MRTRSSRPWPKPFPSDRSRAWSPGLAVAERRALVATGVREGLALLSQELPVVARVVKRQLQHAERGVVLHLRVGLRRTEGVVLGTTRPDDELTHASRPVEL